MKSDDVVLSGTAGRSAPSPVPFLVVHALLLPFGAVLLATWLQRSGADVRITDAFFDAASGRFIVGGDGWAELIGHRLAKSAVAGAWALLIGAAIASHRVSAWRPYRRVLWTTVAAMGLGPLVVTLLKDINTHVCPWDLRQYGGAADYSARWFVSRIESGRCFPGGHASSGYALIALAFAGRALGWRALEVGGLVAALVLGTAFAAVRVSQGAHFVSHNLWSMAIDFWTASLLFAPLLLRRAQRPPAPPAHPAVAAAARPGDPR